MSKIQFLLSLMLCFLFLGTGHDLSAQKRPKPLKPTFNRAAKPPRPQQRGSKPRLEMHHKPKPTLGPASRPVKPRPTQRYNPRRPTTRKGKFNAAAAPRLRNSFNAKAAKRPTPNVRKPFNKAAGGN